MVLVPPFSWIGLALLGIGGVVYFLSSKDPASAADYPTRYMQYVQNPQMRFGRRSRSGVEMTSRDTLSEYADRTLSPYGENTATSTGPRIEGGMFKLPVPIDNDVARFTDLTYNVPTKAKDFAQGRDKGGNSWLPGF